ncbi:F-box/LRR-repeat protein At5g02910-like [Lactuca sativa]|uniref:F-box/LRR-repeat protein At5g02910-like n=1 Tax=Lactuca sativa TaxID=4236 RepID=UPI000CD8EFC1|nr:F-box/LRR-repeat protein At5g02910-like [Lactuca sativa]
MPLEATYDINDYEDKDEDEDEYDVLYTFTPNSGFVAKFLEGKQRNFVAAMEMVEEGQNQPKNPTKRIKFEEIMEEGGEDRISALSDCFLFEILSGLPTTKDPIRTGSPVLETLVLDRCYGFGWLTLNITSKSVKKLVLFGYHEPEYDYEGLEDILDINAPDVLSLTIKGDLVLLNLFEFNNWIRYAVSCHVEEINLSLCNTGNGTEFVFDQFFFINTCFTDLKLSGCIINLIGAISWKNLRSLRISHRKLDEELIENILSGSPLLETLVLEYCYGYRVLNITSQIVKKLVLFGYVDLDDHY